MDAFSGKASSDRLRLVCVMQLRGEQSLFVAKSQKSLSQHCENVWPLPSTDTESLL